MTVLVSRLRLSAYSVALTCTIFSRSTLRCAAHTASRTRKSGEMGVGRQEAGEEGVCVRGGEVRCALDLGSGATKMSTGRFESAGRLEMIASEVLSPVPRTCSKHQLASLLLLC